MCDVLNAGDSMALRIMVKALITVDIDKGIYDSLHRYTGESDKFWNENPIAAIFKEKYAEGE